MRAKPLLHKLDNLVWKAPVERDSVACESIGLQVEPEFETKAGNKFLQLFLDVLPRLAFFRNVLVRESLRYARAASQDFSPHARRLDEDLFTVPNFLRLFAVVIMRGLVQTKDDPTFFKTETHHKFVRTGAKDVCGLSLIQYQQLLRFMHLVDNDNKTRPSESQATRQIFPRAPVDYHASADF